MKRCVLLIAAILAVAPITGCDTEPVKVMEATTVEEKTISCKVEKFTEVSDTEEKSDTDINVGGYYGGNNKYGVVAVPHSSTSYVPVTNHYVYLKDEEGNTAVFKISADCYAVMSQLEGENIEVEYKQVEGVFKIHEAEFTWKGFTLEHQAILDADSEPEESGAAVTEGETE